MQPLINVRRQQVPGGATPPISDPTIGEELTQVEIAVKQDSPPTPTQYYPEYSEWSNEAEELLSNGLERIAQLAKNMHKGDPSKSAEVEFDSSFLQ